MYNQGPYHDDDTAVEAWTHAHMLDDGSEFIVVGLKLIGPASVANDLKRTSGPRRWPSYSLVSALRLQRHLLASIIAAAAV